MTWVIAGASSGVGRALAERLARGNKRLLLVASDARDVSALASDLRITHGAEVGHLAADAADPEAFSAAVAGRLEGDEVEGVLFPLGAVDDSDDGGLSLPEAERLVNINLLAVTALCARVIPAMRSRRRGTLVGFGSIADSRGRGRNVIYAASKRALRSYFESLIHLLDAEGIVVQMYVLGYQRTNLAYGRRLLFPAADPGATAELVARRLGGPSGVRYVPAFWRLVDLALRRVPWFMFRRMKD